VRACVLAKDFLELFHIPLHFAGVGGGGGERGTQQENSYTKHGVTNRLHWTPMLGRVKEAPILLTTCLNVQCFLRRRQLLTIKTNRLGSEDHRVATKCYSWRAYGHD